VKEETQVMTTKVARSPGRRSHDRGETSSDYRSGGAGKLKRGDSNWAKVVKISVKAIMK